MKQFKVIFLLIAFISLVFTLDCTQFLNKKICSAHLFQCQWTITTFLCQNKVDCNKNITSQECDQDETNCKWIQNDQSCTLKPNTCQLTKDMQSCNFTKSCNYIQGKKPTCTPKGSFGCNDMSKDQCLNTQYCTWDSNSCQYIPEQCQKLNITECQKYPNFCKSIITKCDQTIGASKICQMQYNLKSCTDVGCVWINFNLPSCSPPECKVIIDQQGQTSCSANQYLCKVTEDDCVDKLNNCNYDTLDDCKNKSQNFCSWEGRGCYDNESYCKTDFCSIQQCDYTPGVLPQCTNNDVYNECKNQSSQVDCVALNQCNYNPKVSECDNIQNCSIYPDSFCQKYPECSWNPIYKCTPRKKIIQNQSNFYVR